MTAPGAPVALGFLIARAQETEGRSRAARPKASGRNQPPVEAAMGPAPERRRRQTTGFLTASFSQRSA